MTIDKNNNGQVIIKDGDRTVATMSGSPGKIHGQTQVIEAQKLAAASDLLESIKELVTILEGLNRAISTLTGNYPTNRHPALKNACDIILKAEAPVPED